MLTIGKYSCARYEHTDATAAYLLIPTVNAIHAMKLSLKSIDALRPITFGQIEMCPESLDDAAGLRSMIQFYSLGLFVLRNLGSCLRHANTRSE